MNNLHLTLFGSPQVIINNRVVSFASRKAIALLAYLAVTARPHRRDALTVLFWPESDKKRGRGALRYTLSVLRKSIGDSWLQSDNEELCLKQESLTVDINQFRQAIMSAAWAEAVAYYQADFLVGFGLRDAPAFDDWVYFETEALRGEMKTAVTNLCQQLSQVGQYQEALGYAQRWYELDNFDEAAHQQIMKLQAALGNRSAVIQQYDLYTRLLARELDLTPTAETTTLYQQLLTESRVMARQPSIAAPSHNLPEAATAFVGRTAAIKSLTAALCDPMINMVAITGTGGMGKTRLALAVARALLPQFADGVYLVRLAGINSVAGVVAAIADARQVPLYEGSEPETQLSAHLHGKQILLLLDNIEQLLVDETETAVLALFTRLSTLPGLKLLLTSRHRLNLRQVQQYPLHGLNIETGSAADLFYQQALRASAALDGELCHTEVAALCQLVAGMPLAIELAATLAATISLPILVARLRHNLDLLQTTLQDLPQRHRSIRQLMDSSWQTLTPTEQRLLQQLSVCRGGFTLTAGQAITQATPEQLTSLVDKSWLKYEAHPGRYEMHPLMQQYAAEQLMLHGDVTQARQQHADYYGHCLQQHLSDWQTCYDVPVLDAVVAENDNLVQGWRWLLAQAAPAELTTYSLLLCQLYKARGRLAEATDILHQLLDRAEQAGGDAVTWHRHLGEAYFSLGRMDASQHHLEQAITIMDRSVPKTTAQLIWHSGVAVVLQRWPSANSRGPDSSYEAAAHAYDRLAQIAYLGNDIKLTSYAVLRGLNIACQGPPSPIRAVLHANAAILWLTIQQRRVADSHIHRAQTLCQTFDDLPTQAAVMFRSGIYYASAGELIQAYQAAQQSHQLFLRLGDWRNVGDNLMLLGGIALFRGAFDKANHYARTLGDLAQKSQNREHQVWALVSRALTNCYLDRLDEAITLLQRCQPLITSQPTSQLGVMIYYATLGLVKWWMDEKAEAVAHAQTAARLASSNTPTSVVTIIGQWLVAEVLCAAYTAAPSTALKQQAQAACKALRWLAHLYPTGRPYADFYSSYLVWQMGGQSKGQQLWQQARLAERQHNPSWGAVGNAFSFLTDPILLESANS